MFPHVNSRLALLTLLGFSDFLMMEEEEDEEQIDGGSSWGLYDTYSLNPWELIFAISIKASSCFIERVIVKEESWFAMDVNMVFMMEDNRKL